MKKMALSLLLIFILLLAYASKPDDKTCIIKAVQAVWGDLVPNVETRPLYFEQFMNITSQAVEVDDWIFLKRIQYKTGKEKKTVGYGFFKRVLIIS